MIDDKGNPEIIRALRVALELRGQHPAFKRGRMYWDFDLGKVCIADAAEIREKAAGT